MKQNGTPLLFAILLLAAVFPATRGIGPAPKEEVQIAKSEETTPKPADERPSAAVLATRWKDPLQPFQDFFTLEPPQPTFQESLTILPKGPKQSGADREYKIVQREPSPPGPTTVQDVVRKARVAGYSTEFLIALVPDPIDSSLALRFDQAVDGIQNAYAAAGYLPDRFWLPWKQPEGQPWRRLPGLLLFRKVERSKRHLAAVLLVGETPKIGIQKVAFAAAIELERAFMAALGESWTVRILGPSFSGSAESLRFAFAELGLQGIKDLAAPPLPSTYRMVTGSATAPGLEENLGGPIAFQRTVLPDDVLQRQAFCFLQDQMGWRMNRVALLSESDTVYGQETDATPSRMERVSFPSGLSNIRNEWEKNGVAKSSAGPVEVPKSTLSLSLGEGGQPVDLVPEFSPLTLRSKDLAMANLLSAISRGGIRYVGILATDPRDKLFLARRIREFSPDVVLFTFDNNLLYAHPEHTAEMDGMLVLTGFPLFTENRRWRDVLGGPRDLDEGKYRRQFASEFEEGIFQAAQTLIDAPREKLEKRVWIAVVGNGSLWPIAALLPTCGAASSCSWDASLPPFLPKDKNKEPLRFDILAGRTDLQLGFFALLLGGLGWWLWRVGRPLYEAGVEHRLTMDLLGLGFGALWLAGGILLVVGTLSLMEAPWQQSLLFLSLTGAAMVVGAWLLARRRRSKRPSPHGVVWAVALLAATAALPWILHCLWMPGGPELFHLRARKFSSGLSPVVAVFFFLAATYAWSLLEVKRRLGVVRHTIAWPMGFPCEPQLSRCRRMSRPLRRLLTQTLPGRTFWVVFCLAVLPPTALLLVTVQPITEPAAFGRVFIVLVVFAGCLTAMSFYRFLALWMALRRILDRVNNTHLTESLKRVSPQINWKPMKSFGWQMPSFNLLVLGREGETLSEPGWRARR